MILKPRQWLHASCSDEWFQILAVGEDANGHATIDLEVQDINEFIDCRWDNEDGDGGDPAWQKPGDPRYGMPSLMCIEPAGPVVFRGLQWRPTTGRYSNTLIECNTPGHGCYRCTELFSVHEEKRL